MAFETRLISRNRSGARLVPKGVVVHDTATPGATVENEFNYFNSGNRQASAHAFVDWTNGGTILQTVPFDEQAWHAGPTANRQFIGVELCVPKEHDPDKFNIVWNCAVDFFSDLFVNQVGAAVVTKDNLMSHAEVSDKWGETNHRDPIAYFAEYSRTVDDFRWAVQQAINAKTGAQAAQVEPSAEDCVQDFVWRGIISDKRQWIDAANANGNIYWLLNKAYKYIRANGGSVKGRLTDVNAALDVLKKQGIISDAALWQNEIGRNGNVKWLILKIADYIC